MRASKEGVGLICCALVAVGLLGCRQAQPTADADNVAAAPAPVTPAGAESQKPPQPPTITPIPIAFDDPEQWLTARKLRNGAPGGWVTGSFDPKRNKIDIRTRDVSAFALDVSRIPIDWDRIVILSLNGSNSELRRRKQSVYRFQLDEHGLWKVIER